MPRNLCAIDEEQEFVVTNCTRKGANCNSLGVVHKDIFDGRMGAVVCYPRSLDKLVGRNTDHFNSVGNGIGENLIRLDKSFKASRIDGVFYHIYTEIHHKPLTYRFMTNFSNSKLRHCSELNVSHRVWFGEFYVLENNRTYSTTSIGNMVDDVEIAFQIEVQDLQKAVLRAIEIHHNAFRVKESIERLECHAAF